MTDDNNTHNKNTDRDHIRDTIDKFALEATPIRPIMSPHLRAVLWLLAMTVLAIIGILIFGARQDIPDAMTHPLFIIETIMLAIAGICATFATFRLSEPKEKIDIKTYILLGGAALTLFISKFSCILFGGLESFAMYLDSVTGLMTTAKGIAIIIIPAVLLYIMLSKAAPVHLIWTGAAAFTALASFMNIACKMMCPIDDPGYLLIWHYMPLAIIVAVGAGLSRKLLKW